MNFDIVKFFQNNDNVLLLATVAILVILAALFTRMRMSSLGRQLNNALSEAVRGFQYHMDDLNTDMRARLDKISKNQDNTGAGFRQTVSEELSGVVQDIAVVIAELKKKLDTQIESTDSVLQAQQRETRDMKAQIEKNSVHLHDCFAALRSEEETRIKHAQDSLAAHIADIGRQDRTALQESLNHSAQLISESVNRLSAEVDVKLSQVTQKVSADFSSHLANTMDSFQSLQVQMQALMQANKEMEGTGRDVASLTRLMMNKTSQPTAELGELLAMWLPNENYALQARIKGEQVSALILLPGEEGGAIALDGGLSLTVLEELLRDDLDDAARQAARQRFGDELKLRISKVAATHIAPPETISSALLFVPSELAFAEIQAHHPDVTVLAAEKRVWLTSPTTLAAALNFARGAIKDYQAREHLAKMQAALQGVVKEAQEFENRLLEIGDHIGNAMRSVKRAESAGNKLFGQVRRAVGDDGDSGEANPAVGDRHAGGITQAMETTETGKTGAGKN